MDGDCTLHHSAPPSQEIFSIDESFIGLAGVRGNLVKRGHDVRERILQWIGIPTGIGIGATKTLAKLANHVAKSADRKPGSYSAEHARVCNLAGLPAADLDAVLEATDVGEVWGIGRRIAKQMRDEGVVNVLQLVEIDLATIRRRWSVVLERTVRELQGQTCILMEDAPPPKQEIAYTRSFGHPVTTLYELTQAVTEFASGAGAKLRLQGGLASQINVFIHTSPFRPGPQYSNSTTMPLRRPTSDTPLLVQAAVRGLKIIYRPGFNYIKAGVMLLDLHDGSVKQYELDLEDEPAERGHLMSTMDKLNDRYGRGTVLLASAGLEGKGRSWSMRQNLLTPSYTTRWDELPVAKA